ncbi:MAG TPA: right-handed parallel beta-helix repeat-containing protein [Clostridia bacterium]|nr:right-handed parallel beta-helix repeat-containing protein [Clostridia bacterium]
MKRLISVLLISVMLFSLSVCAGYETNIPDPAAGEETARAAELGLVPENIWGAWGDPITFSQYCSMLEKMLSAYNAELVPEWKETAKLALASDRKMRRDDGMLALYYAACIMDIGSETNGVWQIIHNLCGEDWDDMSWDYPLFPAWKDIAPFCNDPGQNAGWDYMTSAYFYCMGQQSSLSRQSLFDCDTANGTMRSNEAFTREEAVKSVLRLYESAVKMEAELRISTDWDTAFLARADERRRAILDSETSIKKSNILIKGETYTGTAYYVSNDGDDEKDGTTPEKAWATARRVGTAQLKHGDAVFFERGGLWREVLICQEGVTYSAYGTGVKPRFYGSKENGAGAEKWSLWHEGADGVKIWLYHKDVTDCGGIVFDEGKSYASRVYADWDGSKYISFKNPGAAFDAAADLKNDLQFCCISDLTGNKLPIYVYDVDTAGRLYLRCDSGNPGEIYSSIEFQTATHPAAGYAGIIQLPDEAEEGCVIDNLCVMYGSCVGIMSHYSSNLLIQNCEVAWVGGNTHEYNGSGYVPVAGEGIKMEGSGNVVRSCYVHDCFDGGIISEVEANTSIQYMGGQAIRGNLIERCMSGVLIVHKDENTGEPRFGNFVIEDNFILNSGYGWSGDANYDYTWRSGDYEGTAITFWDMTNRNDGIYIRNNVFYLAKSALFHAAMPKEYQPVFSGNTYVQNKYGLLAYWPDKNGITAPWSISMNDIEATLRTLLGDEAATVVPPN